MQSMDPMMICGSCALVAVVLATYFYTKAVDSKKSKLEQDAEKNTNTIYAVLALFVAAGCALYAYSSVGEAQVAVPRPTTSLLKSPENL